MERKRKSGAQYRRERREREEAQQGPDVADLGAFAAVGPPPFADLNRALLWSRRMLMTVTYAIATSPVAKLSEKRYAISDMVAKLGLTHAKSLLDEDLERLQQYFKRAGSRRSKAITVSTKGITKPATARGAKPNKPEGA